VAPLPLAVSMGDPTGIGPELVATCWQRARARGPVEAEASFLVCGDPAVLAAHVPVREVGSAGEAARCFGEALPVLPGKRCKAPVVPGRPDPAHAEAILDAITQAVRLALAGEAAGIVTAPIAKEPLYAAGFAFPGHTEFLGALTEQAPVSGPRGPVMMLAGGGLRVALATVHVPLREVAGRVSKQGLIALGELVDHALRQDFGIAHPRLVMAGLNPHAGEGGGIGREEIEVVAPAVEALRQRGIDVRGPLSADTMFHAEARATYDAALCLYHDQGLIPLKLLAFWEGVNITLGLPVVRTSPDHGTGFDIAGRGIARADSFEVALVAARQIAACRTRSQMAQPSAPAPARSA
jgi:4-hydroxythreonine-4-phosphate dehydrogenase